MAISFPQRAGALIPLGLTISLALSGLASAQERLPYRGGANSDLTGARYIKAGALLLATFDANKDLEISKEEIQYGARLAFVYADGDGNGQITPLEQRAWAGRLTSETDVIANPSLFPSAIPGMVTEDEFVIGLETFAQRFEGQDGKVLLSNLTFEPNRPGREDDPELDDGIERLKRPVVGDRTNRRDASGWK